MRGGGSLYHLGPCVVGVVFGQKKKVVKVVWVENLKVVKVDVGGQSQGGESGKGYPPIPQKYH